MKSFTVSFCRQSDLALLIVKLGPLNDSTCSSSINRSICAPKRHIYASSFNKCSCPSKRHTSICASSFNKCSCPSKRHMICASLFNKRSCPSKRHTSICASSFNKYISPSKRHICASSFNKCSYPSRAISDISKLVTINILVSSSSAFIDMPRSTLSYKNSWSQGRPYSSPVQSIVTCECHNHVVSV